MDTASASGPFGSDPLLLDLLRVGVAPAAARRTAPVARGPWPPACGGAVMLVVSGKNVRSRRSWVIGLRAVLLTTTTRGSCGTLLAGSTTTLPLKATWYVLQQVVQVGLRVRADSRDQLAAACRGRPSARLFLGQERVGRTGNDEFGGVVGHRARGQQVERRGGEVVALRSCLIVP